MLVQNIWQLGLNPNTLFFSSLEKWLKLETKQIFEVGEGVVSRWRTSDSLWQDGHQLMLSIKATVYVCLAGVHFELGPYDCIVNNSYIPRKWKIYMVLSNMSSSNLMLPSSTNTEENPGWSRYSDVSTEWLIACADCSVLWSQFWM